MEPSDSEKQIVEIVEDLLLSNVNVSSQEVPNGNCSEQMIQASLGLENFKSLSLFPCNSIQKVIPLSKNMLSVDMYPNDQNFEQQSSDIRKLPQQSSNNPEDESKLKIDEQSISRGIPRIKLSDNTKNVLRNFGGAQNQYALYNKDASKIIEEQISKPKQFREWVRTLKLQTFENYKAVWRENSQHKKIYSRVYKKLCWKFYSETAVSYALKSRMKNAQTKNSHLKYVYRFLEGLQNPQDFDYFKKNQK